MESPLLLVRMHWDHEPPLSCSVPGFVIGISSFGFRISFVIRHSSSDDLCKSGSRSQCAVARQRSLCMNLPGHRIVAWLGKAALKTHAVQTLRDCWTSPNRAKRLECVRFIGAFHPARDGARFMVAMHAKNESNIRWGIASRLVRCSELDVRCSMLDVFLPFGSGRGGLSNPPPTPPRRERVDMEDFG